MTTKKIATLKIKRNLLLVSDKTVKPKKIIKVCVIKTTNSEDNTSHTPVLLKSEDVKTPRQYLYRNPPINAKLQDFIQIKYADGKLGWLKFRRISQDDDEYTMDLNIRGKHCSTAANVLNEDKIPMSNYVTKPDTAVIHKPVNLVDKYLPKCFLDLASNEESNLKLSHWLHLWDMCVFGKNYLEACSSKNIADLDKNVDGYDAENAPFVKIALIAGNAGVGKTVCAHFLARFNGYNVVEINASDDRSVQSIKKVISNSGDKTWSESYGNHGKPNCYVLDEIDGAQQESINALCKAAVCKDSCGITRPIICICNDLYAKELTKLRRIAYVVKFGPVSTDRLRDRLDYVLENENLNLDWKVKDQLVTNSNGDIRSMLNMLQYLCMANLKKEYSDVMSADCLPGLFQILQQIFSFESWERILCSVSTFGNLDLLLDGVYQNYLNHMTRYYFCRKGEDVLDWCGFYDIIHETLYTQAPLTQALSILTMCFVGIGEIFRNAVLKPKMSFPTNILTQKNFFENDLMTHFQSLGVLNFNFRDFCLDTRTYLNGIVQAKSIRRVTPLVWNTHEKELCTRIAHIMSEYGCKFADQQDGTFRIVPECLNGFYLSKTVSMADVLFRQQVNQKATIITIENEAHASKEGKMNRF